MHLSNDDVPHRLYRIGSTSKPVASVAAKSLEEEGVLSLNDFVSDRIGLPTLTDIMEELAKPGRDPREKFGFFEFAKGIHSIEDLEEGMILPGIITNITAFGAFVDIGIKQNGLIHVSHMADRFIRDPNEVVKLNQRVKARVVKIDKVRKRIQLSLRESGD